MIVLYNPLSGNGRGESEAKALENRLPDAELSFRDITEIKSYADSTNKTVTEVMMDGAKKLMEEDKNK